MKNRNFKNISERLIALLMCLCMIFGLFAMSACNTSADTAEEPDEEPAGESVETVQVLRVIDDIKYGAKFTNDKLSVVTVRADAVPEGAATSISDLKGKFSAAPLYVGDFVTAEKVLDKKPVDADDDEEGGSKTTYVEELGYIVITDYKQKDHQETFADVVNRVIAENPGRTIYFPDGDYQIDKPIVIPADPAKSVSLRLSNQAVIRAASNWPDKNLAMIRVGVEDEVATAAEGDATATPAPAMDDANLSENRSIHIIGGCIWGSRVAAGISIEGGKDAFIYNVSLKSIAGFGIHAEYVNNELGAAYANIDNVNITGNDSVGCIGVLVSGTYNTFSNMRIASCHYGVKCTETGSNNIFRNLHPLAGTGFGNSSVGFYDMSDGNNYDVCYSDQFETGFVMYENTRSVYNGSFCYWYSEKNGYHVGFRSVGKYNSIWVSGKVSQSHDVTTDAYMLVCNDEEGKDVMWKAGDPKPSQEDVGYGVVIYPIHGNKTTTYKYILEYFCRTTII